MANQEQLNILNQGVEAWNNWRKENPNLEIDLKKASLKNKDLAHINLNKAILMNTDFSGTDLSEAELKDADFNGARLILTNLNNANLEGAFLGFATVVRATLIEANLKEADFTEADFTEANLSRADLSNANLWKVVLVDANLSRASLKGAYAIEANFMRADLNNSNLSVSNLSSAYLGDANISEANLYWANLMGADLNGANLKGANLERADLWEANLNRTNLIDANLHNARLSNSSLIGAKINNANISNSQIYGVNVWDLEGEFKEQRELIITPDGASVITVDNIKVAHFVYLILNNKEIRNVLNTLTSKTVLILGRFALPERKVILDSLRNKLREYDLLPIVFDFERPDDKDFTETIKTLAGMCYFVIADVTNPKSSPLELQATVPDYQIPFVPIIQEGENPFAMMVDLQKKYDWVLDTISYKDSDQLIRILKKGIIDRAMQKHDELRLIKAQKPTVISASQFEE